MTDQDRTKEISRNVTVLRKIEKIKDSCSLILIRQLN